MQDETYRILGTLIKKHRIAALGTLNNDGPMVSMVLYASAEDFSAFYIHISQLAKHTRNIQANSRVSLMISESELAYDDPQAMARISILGVASRIPPTDPEFEEIRSIYLRQNPDALPNFDLGDFDLFRIEPTQARFIAGLGKIYDLGKRELAEAARMAD